MAVDISSPSEIRRMDAGRPRVATIPGGDVATSVTNTNTAITIARLAILSVSLSLSLSHSSATPAMAGKGVGALRQFTLFKGKSGGRNAQGRITAYHRGGGAKRLLRQIDLKRSVPGVGIVERLEYDPNRSSKIALVRWIEGGMQPRRRKGSEAAVEEELASLREKILGSTTAAADGGRFSFSSLPGKVDQSHANGVFSSALSSSSKAAEGEAASSSPFGGSVGLPRIAVAGAKPAFFASRVRDETGGEAFSLGEIRAWRPDRDVWAHRIKRKAAISWQSIRHHSTLGTVGASRHEEATLKVEHGEGLGLVLSLGGPSSQNIC